MLAAVAAPASAQDPADCGTVVVPIDVGVAAPAPANTLHPVLAATSTPEQEMYRLLFRPVVLPSNAGRVDWSTSLAQSIDVADGGATYRITLKPYLCSDGVPVTADDVLYCWQMIRQLGPAFSNYGTGGVPQIVRGLTVTGPHSFEIRLVRAVNPDWFETNAMSLLYALPRHAWGRLTIEQQQTRQSEPAFYQVVDGAFRLERLAPGRYASFTPNPRFGGHHPGFRRLVVSFLQGADPLEELRSGDLDIVNLPFSVWQAARSLADFDQISIGAGGSVDVIMPNLASPSAPFLADLGVRQAIAMAIDQQRIVGTAFHGQGVIQQGFVPTQMTAELSPAIRAGRSSLAFDPAGAAALLDAAGWHRGTDGVRQKEGRRLVFEVLTTAGIADGLVVLQLVRSDLARVGIELRIKEVEFNQIMARVVGPASGWQAVYFGQPVVGFPDGTQFFQTGSVNNFGRYTDATMDRLLDASIVGSSLDGLFALEDYVLAQQPELFLPSAVETVLVRPGIGGVRQFVNPNGTWLPEYLTVSGALACH